MPDALATSPDTGARDAAIQAQLTRLLFNQTRIGAATTLAVGLAVAAYFWTDVPGTSLPIWLVGLLLVSAGRHLLLGWYRRAEPPDSQLAAWHRRYLVGAFASGLVFGSLWWLVAPHTQFQAHLLLAFALGGMALGAVPLLGASPRVHAAYTAAVGLPPVTWMVMQATPSYTSMALMGGCFILAVLATGHTYHRAMVKMMKLAVANRALREHQIRLRDFANMGSDLFWESDRQGRFTYLSDGYEKLTGIPAREMLGTSLDGGRGPRFLPPEHLGQEGGSLADRPFTDHALKWEPDDDPATVMLSSAIPIHDTDGGFVGLRGTVRDITQQHQLAQKLSHQASHDSLTDLVNRREFEQRLKALLAQARERALSGDHSAHALCYLDLDQFKLVNDTCGHAAGDALLKQLSGVLRQRLRTRDTLARLGGDEFAVLIERCGADDALVVAEGIRSTVESMRFQWEDTAFNLTTSIGVVSVDADCASAVEIMMAADAACYAAKDGGRNRVHVYQAQDEALSRRHGEMQWVTRITRALESDRLAIAAQPIASLQKPSSRNRDVGLAHFEVLLRMRGDDHSLISPNAFLPAAERYYLATRLDLWVFDRTAHWLLAVPGRLQQVQTCCINLCAQSISDDGFLEHLSARFAEHAALGKRVCFELSETSARADLDQTIGFIKRFRRLGCRFTLDDFGTGLSSFGYLKSLPVDHLKIDGVLVRGMIDDEVSRAMVKSIQEVARIMGKKTIAEHAENDATVAMLRQLGVDYAQGHALAAPRPLEQMQAAPVSNVVNLHR